ncbi:sulfurtransferase TusA family protein [Haloglomus litoreum]|uniref:sulfurtransferase TusA family protein n=1 Tax=Haloglomus litoreum TaxID=3034026 RepID=UPI0023E7A717|nr:sulfurtransferase TusA family protein [Haloglomus sp. DT116]
MSQSDIEVDVTIDARGATCPGPLMDLVGEIRNGAVGTVYELQTNDSSSSHDVPEWVAQAGHETIDIVEHEAEGYWSIFIEKSK